MKRGSQIRDNHRKWRDDSLNPLASCCFRVIFCSLSAFLWKVV